MAVVMLHMINPWGAAWNRKQDENNVECLQNFFWSDRGSPENPLFDEVDDAIHLVGIKSVEEFFASLDRVQSLYRKYGRESVMAAYRYGQASRPKANMFCGTEPSWSKRILDCVVQEYLQGAKRVAFLDIHTALGGYGEVVAIPAEEPGSELFQMIVQWFDGDIFSDQPIHPGLYNFIEDLIPGCEVAATIVECGTEPRTEDDRYIFALDTWLHAYGDPQAPENQRYMERYRRVFYPEFDEWKVSIWRNGQRRLQQITRGLASWAALF
jgi:hypothetical protein